MMLYKTNKEDEAMSIQLIINEIDKIEARSILGPLKEEECLRIYRELLKIKERFLMISYVGVTEAVLEDTRLRLMENLILYRRYIKEFKHIAFEREMGQLSLLYKGGIA